MSYQAVFNQELLHFFFELERRQSRYLNLSWNQRIVKCHLLANPNVAGKFRDVENVNMQQVARPDRHVVWPGLGESSELLNSLVGLLRSLGLRRSLGLLLAAQRAGGTQQKYWHCKDKLRSQPVRNGSDGRYHSYR